MRGCIAVVCVIVMCAFGIYCLTDIKPSSSPVAALTSALSVNILFSLVNLLKTGRFVSYALCVILFAAGIVRRRKDIGERIKSFFTPSVIFFIGASLFLAAYLSSAQPVFSEWDEFSFWGIASKQTYTHDAIYTYFKSSMLGVSTPPALPVLTYFFMLPFAEYCEWAAFFAYDVLILACITAFSRVSDGAEKHMSRVISVFGVMSVYFFENTSYTDTVSRAFISAYSDMPLGFLFAAALSVFIGQDEKGTRGTLCALPVIFALTNTKDMGFALSCIVAFVLFFHAVCDKNEFRFFRIKGIAAKIVSAAIMLITTLAAFVGWSFHISETVNINRAELGGEAGMSMAGLLISGVKELLIKSARSEKFSAVLGSMLRGFFTIRVCSLGAGIVLFAFITSIFITAFVTAEKDGRLTVISAYITSCIGFAGYYIFHLFLYVYVFKDEAYSLASYDRYMCIYYIGWLVLAVVMLTKSAAGGRIIPQTAAVFVTAVMIMLFAHYVKPDNMLFAADDNTFADRYNVTQKTEWLKDVIGSDDVIWVYSGDDTGGKWFIYCYELSDNYIVPDWFAQADANLTDEENARAVTQAMYEYFKEYGVTNVLIDYGSYELAAYFDGAFDVAASQWGLAQAGYYKVNYTGDGMTINLIKGGTVIDG